MLAPEIGASGRVPRTPTHTVNRQNHHHYHVMSREETAWTTPEDQDLHSWTTPKHTGTSLQDSSETPSSTRLADPFDVFDVQTSRTARTRNNCDSSPSSSSSPQSFRNQIIFDFQISGIHPRTIRATRGTIRVQLLRRCGCRLGDNSTPMGSADRQVCWLVSLR